MQVSPIFPRRTNKFAHLPPFNPTFPMLPIFLDSAPVMHQKRVILALALGPYGGATESWGEGCRLEVIYIYIYTYIHTYINGICTLTLTGVQYCWEVGRWSCYEGCNSNSSKR